MVKVYVIIAESEDIPAEFYTCRQTNLEDNFKCNISKKYLSFRITSSEQCYDVETRKISETTEKIFIFWTIFVRQKIFCPLNEDFTHFL